MLATVVKVPNGHYYVGERPYRFPGIDREPPYRFQGIDREAHPSNNDHWDPVPVVEAVAAIRAAVRVAAVGAAVGVAVVVVSATPGGVGTQVAVAAVRAAELHQRQKCWPPWPAPISQGMGHGGQAFTLHCEHVMEQSRLRSRCMYHPPP